MGKEYIPHSGTQLKDTGFTLVLAKNLRMGLTLNTYQSPLEKGRLRTKGQQSLDNSFRSLVGSSSCLFPFSLWNLHQVREKCLMSCLAKTAHLQSEVRNEESQGFRGRGAGWNTHTVCPPLTTGTSLIFSLMSLCHQHHTCTWDAVTLLRPSCFSW